VINEWIRIPEKSQVKILAAYTKNGPAVVPTPKYGNYLSESGNFDF